MFSDGVVYNCFNCKFSTSWLPGRPISEKFKSLCNWLGASDDDIRELIFEALKTESTEYKPEAFVEKVKFTAKELPEGAMSIAEWVNSAYLPDIAKDIGPVIDYVIARGFDPMSKNFYWSPAPGFIDRVLLPYYYDGKIVGSTARKIGAGKPKYVSDQHPFFVFNVDEQEELNKYVFVVEGQFDALSIGGVALLTNEVSDQQARIINNIGKEVIVVPDRDKAGTVLIDQAHDLGWAVAFPSWGPEIKDPADAVQKYGKLFVIVDVLKTATTNPAKIEIEKRKLLQELEKQND